MLSTRSNIFDHRAYMQHKQKTVRILILKADSCETYIAEIIRMNTTLKRFAIYKYQIKVTEFRNVNVSTR